MPFSNASPAASNGAATSVARNRRRLLIGFALGIGSASLFSLKGVVIKLAFAAGGTVDQIMAFRMAFSLPFFLIVGVVSRQRTKSDHAIHDYGLAVCLGVVGHYICSYLDFTGLLYISAQLERLILFLYPTITAVLARLFLGERMTWRHAGALVMSYAGVGVLAGWEIGQSGLSDNGNAALGAGLVFLAAILFAVNIAGSKPVIARLGSLLFTSVAMASASVAILLHFGINTLRLGWTPIAPETIMLCLFLALACTVAPSFMISEAIARLGAGRASAIGGIGPPIAAMAAVLALNEPFEMPHAIALILSIVGISLLASLGRTKDASETPA